MLYFLDSNVVIYALAGLSPFKQRARNHIAALEALGHRFIVSELTWTECLVLPFQKANGPLLLDYYQFFFETHLSTVSLTQAIHHRAAMIRAIHMHKLADSLHWATAVEYRLDRFLTNDRNLVGFPDIVVELLP